MRICISGTCSQGKSTFIEDFLKEWPTYTTPKNTYRKFVKDKHSKKTTKDIQWKILNSMIDELQKHDADDNVIYDRGPLDNVVYTLWARSKDIGNINDEFVQKTITLARESLKHIDIIFYIPITRVAAVEYDTEEFLRDKDMGITDENHRVEIDNLFKAIKRDWDDNPASKFFDPKDKPAIIEIFGSQLERIQLSKLYLNVDGDVVDSTGIMSEQEMREMEALKGQFGIADKQSQAYRNPEG
jgi:hypothetical protein